MGHMGKTGKYGFLGKSGGKCYHSRLNPPGVSSMALPKYRKSKSKTMMRRRQNDRRTLVNVVACREFVTPRPAHRVCPSCGMYKGKTVVRKA